MSSSVNAGYGNGGASALTPVRPDRGLEAMSTSAPAATLQSPNQKTVVGGLGALALAVLTIVTVFKIVDWSAAQTALVTAEAATVAGLITALAAHLMPSRSDEPVALAATFTATVSATLALGSGFGWWSFTVQQTSALAGVVTAVIGVGGALLARRHVTAQACSSNE